MSRKTLATGQVVAGSTAVQYTLTDHAGSADVVVDGAGATIERHSYDPFGKRRSAKWTPDVLSGRQSSDPNLTGYTGHQDDFELGLVNMKGRMYDPKIGRFLTPDPRIGGNPLRSQNLNHYSYVANNPLSFFDPTGFERMEVNLAPPEGDVEITVFVDSDPSDTSITYVFPDGGYAPGIVGERVWGPVNNFGWGDVSRVNVKPLVDQIDASNKKALIKAAHAYAVAVILRFLGPKGTVLLAGVGLLDPSPASAPPSDGTFQPAPQPSALRIAVGVGLPAVLGALGKGRGGGGADPEQIASIENQLGQEAAAAEEASYPEGTFSISDWSGYPGNVRPAGPFRVLEGAEYDEARNAASAANDAMRRLNRAAYQGNQIHEIQPVKFGGSPTDMANKMVTPTPLHYQYTSWWNKLQSDLGF